MEEQKKYEHKLINGKIVAAEIRNNCASKVVRHRKETGKSPCLATVLVSDDSRSLNYIRMKHAQCHELGIITRHISLPITTTTATLVSTVETLSEDPDVHGIFLQYPLPAQINAYLAFNAIAPEKDVDGLTVHSFGTMAYGASGFQSCAAYGIMRLLATYGVNPKGSHAAVITQNPAFGNPMCMLLLAGGATVTYCQDRIQDLPNHTGKADIVVVAVNQPKLVRGAWIKKGAVVLDAGCNTGNIGDVDFHTAAVRASLIAPVPGGVGPVTIALLLEQTADAAIQQRWRAPFNNL